jgi:AcrR family transcriptional regulator
MTPPSRRALTRTENRAALVRASLEVFASIGYDAATVRDIVDASGLSRGTFYNYLGDKETALRAVAETIIEQIRRDASKARAAATSAEGFTQDAFRAMIRAMSSEPLMVSFVTKNGDALRQVVGKLEPTTAIIDDLTSDLRKAHDAGLLHCAHPRWLAAAMVGAAIEVVTRLDHTDDPDVAGDFLSGIFLCGLRGLNAS